MKFVKSINAFFIGFGLALGMSHYNTNWIVGATGIVIAFIGMEFRYRHDL